MRISLRAESGADEPFLRRLILETVTQELAAESWPEPLRSHLIGLQYAARRQAVRTHFPDGHSRIILVDDQEAGWLFVASLADEVRLAEIMILVECRGQGIGSTVIRRLIEHAGDTPVRLLVNVMNSRATHLYERLGFRRVGGDEVQQLMEYHPSCKDVSNEGRKGHLPY